MDKEKHVGPAGCVAFIGGLCLEVRELMPLLQEYLDEWHGAIISHVFMGVIAAWVERNITEHPEVCSNTLAYIEHNFPDENTLTDPVNASIDNMIWVSFLENLSQPGTYPQLDNIMPPRLKAGHHQTYGSPTP